jgi:hypothetical protein
VFAGKGNNANMRWAKVNMKSSDQIDEIEEYISCRDLCAAEAFWRILQYNTKFQDPPVECLPIHLPGSDYVKFDDGDDGDPITAEQMAEASLFGVSKLMRYLNRPKEVPFIQQRYCEYWAKNRIVIAQDTSNLTGVAKYAATTARLDYTEEDEIRGINRCWVWPRRATDRHFARLPLLWPSAGEAYYLRLLLLNLAPSSWDDLLHNSAAPNTAWESFQEAARGHGLFDDENEMNTTFKEAVHLMYSPKMLRNLFVWTLHEGGNGPMLWDYIETQVKQGSTIVNPLSEDLPGGPLHQRNQLLKDIRTRLALLNKTLEDYALPQPDDNSTMLQRCHNMHTCAIALMYPTYRYWAIHDPKAYMAALQKQNIVWSQEQQAILGTVQTHVDQYMQNKDGNGTPVGHFIFMNGRSGCGKSEILQHITNKYRGAKMVVMCVAPTGLVALKFNGHTAHNAFGIKVCDEDNPTDDQLASSISPVSQKAEMLRNTDIFVWDELPNQHSNVLMASHELLCTLMATPHTLPFGGKIVISAGDFRQIPPVVRSWLQRDVLRASVGSCPLYLKHATKLLLTQSQRDKADPEYAQWVLSLGNGTAAAHRLLTKVEMQTTNRTSTSTALEPNMVEIPSMVQAVDNIDGAIDFCFPNIGTHLLDRKLGVNNAMAIAESMASSAIISSTNNRVDEINKRCLEKVPGKIMQLSSSNGLGPDQKGIYLYDEFYLQSLTPRQVPPHILQLKLGSLVIVLRNMSNEEQCMNGSKAIITGLPNNFMVELLMVPSGEKVLLRRIKFYYKMSKTQYYRTQFPLRSAYGLTINKSQGQTLSKVVNDSEAQPFTHGACYVGFGRVQNRDSVAYLRSDKYSTHNNKQMVRNLAWPQLLKHAGVTHTTLPTDEQPVLQGKLGAQTHKRQHGPHRYPEVQVPQKHHKPQPPNNANEVGPWVTHNHQIYSLVTQDATRPTIMLKHANGTEVEVPTTMVHKSHHSMSTMVHAKLCLHWSWGDGNCFYYAIAMLIDQLQSRHSLTIFAALHGEIDCVCPQATVCLEDYRNKHVQLPTQCELEACSCEICGSLAMHRLAASELRAHAHNELAEHKDWMLEIQGGPNNAMAVMELNTKLQNMEATQCVDETYWASDYDIRCTAINLGRDIYVLEDLNSGRGIQCAKYSGIASSMNEVAISNPRVLYTVCTQEEAVAMPNNLCIFYNGTTHFEPLMHMPQHAP